MGRSVIILFVMWASACGGAEGGGPGDAPVDTPAFDPAAPGAPAAEPAPGPMSGPVAGADGQASPEAPMAPSPVPSQTPAMEGMEPGDEVPSEPGSMTPAADDCEDRRVSYSKPCHADPNPCGIDSGFPGDEYCLVPPPEGEGVQIHIGPDDYSDPAEIAKYVLMPGDEFNNSVLGHIPLEDDVWINRITVQMRPGSHHWISSVVEGKPEERVYDGTDCGGAPQVGSLGGGQNLIYDNPPGGVHAPENEGLGRSLPGNSSLCMNLHAYNVGEVPQLREIWINVYTVDESEVTQRATGIGVVGGLGMSVPAGEKETLTYTETFDGPGRIVQLFGHRHAWTPRFAVWLNDRLIYDSWDWYESITFNYDSLTENPPINTEMQVDGAVSGVIEVSAGDELTFSCFIENESEQTLRWSNELYNGEMCNLWGSAVGSGIWATRF